jgi:hypothetical protein
MTELQKRISDLGAHLYASTERIGRECAALRSFLDALRQDAAKFGAPAEDVAALDELEQRITELEEVLKPADVKPADVKRVPRPGKQAAAS